MIDKSYYNKILIIGPSWLGDMVMAQALFKALISINSNTQIDVVAPSWSFSLLNRIPEVTNKIELNIKHGKLAIITRYQLAKKLIKNNYSQAIVLPNSWKAALIPWLAKIPIRTGWLGELRFGLINDLRYLNKKHYPLMVSRYLALAYIKNTKNNFNYNNISLFNPKLNIDLNNINFLLKKFKINNNINTIVLGIDAAFGDAKCWPTEYYLALAEIYIKKNWQVLIIGTKINLTIPAILNSSNLFFNLSNKTSIEDAIDLLSIATIIVCNDSGLMHIAASLNKKVIAIYGPTSELFTPPLAENAITINNNLACSPCFKRTCPLKHHNCMHTITVQQVNLKIKQLCES